MKRTLLAMVCAFCSASLFADSAIPFEDHDKIVFWGDSITDFGWYVPYVQLGLAVKMREKHIEVINAGVGGDTTGRAMYRFDFDVFRFKPRYVAIALGENDLGRGLYKTSDPMSQKDRCLNRALQNIETAIDTIRRTGAEPMILGLTTFDQYSDLESPNYPYYNTYGKARMNGSLKELAGTKGVPFVDIFTPMTAIVEQNPDAHFCGKDRIHPSRAGHLIVALEILKAMGTPDRNAAVRISNGDMHVSNATVTELRRTDNELTFRYCPETLPFPVDDSYRKLAAMSSLPAEVNRESLGVVGLPAGEYDFSVDGKRLGVFTAKDLEAGISIAELDTSNQRKAQALLPLMEAFHRDTVPLRKIAASKMIAVMKKADLTDLVSIDRTLDAWLEECKSSPAFRGRKHAVEIYRKCRGELPELEKRISDLTAQLHAQAVPEECRIHIAPVD